MSMDLLAHLDKLRAELESFSCRPRTLVPDLVLVALATDLLETGIAVLETAGSRLPHKAFANARLAFETAQNILVLATHEDYALAGCIAWVYFESKDASWRAALEQRQSGTSMTPDAWLDRQVREMGTTWNKFSPHQDHMLQDALARVRRDQKKKPDNWLHETMTARQHRAYELFSAADGGAAPADTVILNHKMYEVLCRETHVRPRLESFGIIHDRENDTIRIDILPRNAKTARRSVVGGTELSIAEGITALRWQRQQGLQE